MPEYVQDKAIKPYNGSGKYVRVSATGVVTNSVHSWMDPTGQFPKIPDGEKVTWLIANTNDSKIGERDTSYQQVGIKYPDNSVSNRVTIAGCVLACTKIYSSKENKTGKTPNTRNMVTTARVGIPAEALSTISQGISCDLKDNVSNHNGYMWMTVKVKNSRENEIDASASDSKVAFTQRNKTGGLTIMSNWISVMNKYISDKSNMLCVISFSIRRSNATDTASARSNVANQTTSTSLFSAIGAGKSNQSGPERTISATMENVLCLGPTKINQPPINPITRDMYVEAESSSLSDTLLDEFMTGITITTGKLNEGHDDIVNSKTGGHDHGADDNAFSGNSYSVNEESIYGGGKGDSSGRNNAQHFE